MMHAQQSINYREARRLRTVVESGIRLAALHACLLHLEPRLHAWHTVVKKQSIDWPPEARLAIGLTHVTS